ncbi:hypothetical protein PFICI_04998 [Pestalotiopsis fici W106-1]|uniref:UBZ4-type domain-containing protein n=1 Tax=Pestalotiopsis fici (strain W106-1 / CGMCC3.15140) TaxID=1229662 RepID=W3XCE8_PESFW|nr:uncharacterized protein PFICI_04998 [Pestalotiopsis fici W106-1]ETS83122.1 hypothetical protein PFICI_04998 [Pestalotiopsis fici W106-1]
MPVPNVRQVVPGAGVSIVLKADQRTGREVQGFVKDVLTRGDHHRGIKVRLVDGRIGRVQRMSAGLSTAGSQASAHDDGSATSDGAGSIEPANPPPSGRFPSGRRGQYRDVRLDEHLEAPPEQVDLGAYIVAPKRKGKGRKSKPTANENDASEAAPNAAVGSATAEFASETVTCPVCNAFEGDEAAVAHHVAEHFE